MNWKLYEEQGLQGSVKHDPAFVSSVWAEPWKTAIKIVLQLSFISRSSENESESFTDRPDFERLLLQTIHHIKP